MGTRWRQPKLRIDPMLKSDMLFGMVVKWWECGEREGKRSGGKLEF